MSNILETPVHSSPTRSATGVTTTLATPLRTTPQASPEAFAKLLRLAEALGRQVAQRTVEDGGGLAPLPAREAAR
jgi:hypothetical protein